MKTDKEFDAVRMMRKIRDMHYNEYSKNPYLRIERLNAIHSKYQGKIKNIETSSL